MRIDTKYPEKSLGIGVSLFNTLLFLTVINYFVRIYNYFLDNKQKHF